MIDPDFYAGLAQEAIGKLRRLSAFTKHPGAIGSHHEEILRELLRPVLSRRFSLKTGFVFVGGSTVSSQGDVIIVDEHDPSPYFFQMGDLVVVHPRAVACVVETKTTLAKESFHQSIRNLRSFADVGRVGAPPVRFGRAIFAFEGARFSGDNLHEWFSEAEVPDDPWSYPQIIHVLKEGTLHLENIKPANVFGYRLVMGEESDEFKSKGLSMFLQTIRKALEVKAGLESNPFVYADLHELRFSEQYLRIGHGFVAPGAAG
jgi:hypothetical protein